MLSKTLRKSVMEETKINSNGKAESAPKEGEIHIEQGLLQPVLLTEENGEMSGEEEKSVLESEQKLKEILKNMNEETLQLSDFLVEESKLISELCNSLKGILKKLNISLSIPHQDLPIQRKIKKAVLNQDGNLIITEESGEANSASLAGYPPETVMAVLWIVIPELANAVTRYRKRLNTRVNFFQGIKKELKNAAKAITGDRENQSSVEKQTAVATGETPKNEARSES